jgi:CcmD family protein
MPFAPLRTTALAAVLFAALVVSSVSAAQDPGVSDSLAVVQQPVPTGQAATPSEAATTGVASSTLPARAAPERTLRAYWHVFGAFAITWILLFGYVVALGRRFSRLEQKLEASRK